MPYYFIFMYIHILIVTAIEGFVKQTVSSSPSPPCWVEHGGWVNGGIDKGALSYLYSHNSWPQASTAAVASPSAT
jgi:hypothetical protein